MDVMECPLRHQWDLRTRSPHRLFADLTGAVEDLGYRVEVSEPFQVEESSISESAAVRAHFSAERLMGQRFVRAQGGLGALSLVVGIALLALGFMEPILVADAVLIAAGIILLMLGLGMVATAFQSRKQFLVVMMLGAARRVEGPGLGDIIADVRVVAGTNTALFAGGTEIGGGLARPRVQKLEKGFTEFRNSVEEILPAYMTE